MLMGDTREAAMAVNLLNGRPVNALPLKLTDRQVEERGRCFLFGHYDSRGGATLVEARNLLEAFQRYASEGFCWTVDEKGQLQDPGMRQYMKDDAEYEAWRPDALHSLMEEDFMFSCNVIVCDEPFGDGETELDHGYSEDGGGYRYGVVQYRWLHKAGYAETEAEKTEFSKWSNVSKGCKKTLIFWKGKERPVIDPKALGMDYLPGLEVRIVRKSYGEDACGVCWMPK